MGFKNFAKKHSTDGMMVQMLSNEILKWTICCLMSFHIPLKNIQMVVWFLKGNHFFGGEINQKLTSLMAMWHVHLEIKALKTMSLFTFPCTPCDTLPTPWRIQMWVPNKKWWKNKESRHAPWLATLWRGRGVCCSFRMRLRRVDKFYLLTQTCTKPMQGG